ERPRRRPDERAAAPDPPRHPGHDRPERPHPRDHRLAGDGQRPRPGDRRVVAVRAGPDPCRRPHAAPAVRRRAAPAGMARSVRPHPNVRPGGPPVMKKVVLAYSGGLDTSVAVAWLRRKYDVEVVTLTVDVGGGSLREGVERRAMKSGASRACVVGARDRFVRDFVWPHLPAEAPYQGAHPLATALARPLIAQLLVEVARKEAADAVAHGCTGKGNDQVRFDVAVHALDPGLEVVAPMRIGMGMTRDQEIEYAEERGIEIPVTKASPY